MRRLVLMPVLLAAGCVALPMSTRIHDAAVAVTPQAVALRRDLHAHPELSGREHRTATVVAARLRELGLEVRTGVGGTGVIGILRGAPGSAIVAYRADMDAVPGDEPLRTVRSLEPGVAHLCGHDAHVAIAVGIAETLAKIKARLPGTVVFLFQPAEETLQGAAAMIEDGALTPSPDVIYAVHAFPFETGQIAYAPDEGFAGMDRWSIEVPASAAAPVLDAVQGMGNVQFPVSQEELTRFLAALQNGEAWLREAVWINADTESMDDRARIRVTVKASRDAAYYELRERVTERVLELTKGRGVVRFEGVPFPAMRSDRAEALGAAATLANVLTASNVLELRATVPFAGEDFALFLKKVPGAMFFLGVANRQRGIHGVPHLPDFDLDENSIGVAVRAMSEVIHQRLLLGRFETRGERPESSR